MPNATEAYDLKVGRKKKTDKGNMSGDASPAVLNGSGINIGDLIDFVNTFTGDCNDPLKFVQGKPI